MLKYLLEISFNAALMIAIMNLFSRRLIVRSLLLRHIILSIVIFAGNFMIEFGSTAQSAMPFHFTDFSRLHDHWLEKTGFALNIVLIINVIFYFRNRDQNRVRKIDEQQYQLLELRESKISAELDALHAKTSPHFLYNSLNSIASLIKIDPDKAERMVMLLSKFFRYSITKKNSNLSTLHEELELVTTYLSMEKIRFEDRLTFSIDGGHLSEEMVVPRFLLQPLAENAVKHGISKIKDDATIQISISKVDDNLILIMHDNGPPFPANFSVGYGLSSIDDKLKLLYSGAATINIDNGSYKHIKIVLPVNYKFPPHLLK